MRDVLTAIAIGLATLALCLWLGSLMIQDTQSGHQLKNAYWPYSVETSVKDK